MSELTDFHVFWGAAMAVAEKKSASMEADGAEDFAQRLYDEYVEQGAPKNKRKWLAERLENEFLCLKESPVWVGEPAWLYHQGQPMVFYINFQFYFQHSTSKKKSLLAIPSTCLAQNIVSKGRQRILGLIYIAPSFKRLRAKLQWKF
ncbi:hypothetical protein [Pseudomonas sp. NIBRBAC000502773]|uniref:hypothetical protein n=1 Tax=Pseudomonas sp. NIBRBAC000502773 TaxID=2590776 RepID=UPI0015A75D05|nr:hypothetical protein [Pseudomonas sp. NIBRBAC000502773]